MPVLSNIDSNIVAVNDFQRKGKTSDAPAADGALPAPATSRDTRVNKLEQFKEAKKCQKPTPEGSGRKAAIIGITSMPVEVEPESMKENAFPSPDAIGTGRTTTGKGRRNRGTRKKQDGSPKQSDANEPMSVQNADKTTPSKTVTPVKPGRKKKYSRRKKSPTSYAGTRDPNRGHTYRNALNTSRETFQEPMMYYCGPNDANCAVPGYPQDIAYFSHGQPTYPDALGPAVHPFYHTDQGNYQFMAQQQPFFCPFGRYNDCYNQFQTYGTTYYYNAAEAPQYWDWTQNAPANGTSEGTHSEYASLHVNQGPEYAAGYRCHPHVGAHMPVDPVQHLDPSLFVPDLESNGPTMPYLPFCSHPEPIPGPPSMNRIHMTGPTFDAESTAGAQNNAEGKNSLPRLLAAFHITSEGEKDIPVEVQDAIAQAAANSSGNDGCKLLFDDVASYDNITETCKYLLVALESKCGPEVIKVLLERNPVCLDVKVKDGKSLLEVVVERLVGVMNNWIGVQKRGNRSLLCKAFFERLRHDFEFNRIWYILELLLKAAYHRSVADILPDGKVWRMLHAVAATELVCQRTNTLLLKLALLAYPDEVRQRDEGGKLPIHRAVESGKALGVVQVLLEAYPKSALEKDSESGLYPCLLAAASEKASLDLLFRLLLSCSWVFNVQ